MESHPDRLPRATTALALAGIATLFAALYAWVSPANFSGYDEWLYLSLTTRGIISYPYENRPVVYLWHLPPSLLWPHSLHAYYVAHGLYLVLIGWLTFLLLRRIAPWSTPLAFMAGVLAAAWAPSDHARLNTLGLASYSGHTLGTMIAVVLLVESWVRRRPLLLAMAMVLAFVSSRGTEVAVPLLAVAPLLLFFPAVGRPPWRWILAWESLVVVAGALALWPVLFPPASGNRQHALGLDPRPAAVAERMAVQFEFHLRPAVNIPLAELAHIAVPLIAAVAWLFFRLVAARSAPIGGPEHRKPLAILLGLGLLFAAVGYSAFSLTGSLALPVRTQFFSAPGIAIALAAAVFLALTFTPPAWRAVAGGILMAWFMAVAMGRTLAMQRDWDAAGIFRAQASVLRQLTALAPDLKPNTLVVLLDRTAAFKASYTFWHAVSYLYERRAVGVAFGASDFLYPSQFRDDGVFINPHPAVSGPWRSPPALHDYSELVVVGIGPDGRLLLLDQWPSGWLPPPGAARYAPRARIVAPERPLPERGILWP